MAPRNKNMPPNQQQQLQDTEEVSPLEEEENEPEVVAAEEAWAAAEGYTPLADLRSDGATFMAFHSNEEEDGYSGTFFADMSEFGPSTSTLVDEWNNDEHESDNQDNGGDVEQENEFRSVADQALQALDEEYSMALDGVVIPPFTGTDHDDDSSLKKGAASDERLASGDTPPPIIHNPDEKQRSVTSSVMPKINKMNIAFPEKDSSEKETPDIDTDAVRKAVDCIKLKAPRLNTALNKWEEEHGVSNTSVVALAPREHSIIPKTPLSAFWRQSSRAIAATANLSRSATCAEAIHRLELLLGGSNAQERFVIHIVGADHVECSSEEQLRTTFGPLVRWIGALEDSPRHVDIYLVGPNVPTDATKRPSLDLMPSKKIPTSRLESATATCHEAVYHEWLIEQDKAGFSHPDIAIAYNSGIWGYNEWLPTLQALCKSSYPIPFVSSSYTIQECQDDADVIETSSSPDSDKRCCLWKAEANPFASRKIRETATAIPGREYRENAAWQAWRLGGGNDL